jgi:integrase
MFARKWRLAYQDFILPDPNPFPEIDRLPEPPHRYHSTFDAGQLVSAAEAELRDADPDAYVVFTLAFFCGLRRKEIDRLRWDKVDSQQGHIWVSTTTDNRPKSWKSDAPVDAAKNVFEVLAAYRHRSITPPYVIAAVSRNKRYRCGPIFKRLILWLRGKGVREFRTLHALRAEAGSIIYQQTDSTDVAADFLRNDPRVAREHYIGRKGRLELVLPKATEFSSATAA